MSKVGIVMGSDSDLPTMAKAADVLDSLGIAYEMRIISAHREARLFFEWAESAEENGFSVIIAGAGMAAHLPGMCAALFSLPVIGVPLTSKALGGMDALYSILQMPPGIPVATVALDGAKNAALLAARILSIDDLELRKRLKAYSLDAAEQVEKKDAKLKEIGWKAYLEHSNV
ncbi:MAG: 5-(carboxyamino)imidazole ribonucleotide mutase [Lachnospiraceae bacterium]|nr:5-(carboxyamino)imidazole ribonucleotide mutase [Lachnospiraceae bacterium]